MAADIRNNTEPYKVGQSSEYTIFSDIPGARQAKWYKTIQVKCSKYILHDTNTQGGNVWLLLAEIHTDAIFHRQRLCNNGD